MAIVYLLTNTENGKRYVGKTKATLDRRWYDHVKQAKNGAGFAVHAAIRKYGKDAFTRETLGEYATEEEALLAEREFIATLGTLVPAGYNLCKGGRGAVGMRMPDSAKAAIRDFAIKTGRKPSPLALQRSAEVRANGLSDEAKAALTAGQRRRRAEQPVTDEFREKMRAVALARPPQGPPSAETTAKRSESLRATWAERKAAGFVGREIPPEQRAKISESVRRSWTARRAVGGEPPV